MVRLFILFSDGTFTHRDGTTFVNWYKSHFFHKALLVPLVRPSVSHDLDATREQLAGSSRADVVFVCVFVQKVQFFSEGRTMKVTHVVDFRHC